MVRSSLPPGRKRILVVEDDDTIRNMLHRVFAKEYHVMVASDGRQAMTLSKRAPPDLILLDIMLPGENGFEFAEKIRNNAQLRHAAIVFLTASNTAEDSIKALRVGSKYYITKPFNIRDVVAKVARILASGVSPSQSP